jgi:ABC-type sugar transport system substrate-binding protein
MAVDHNWRRGRFWIVAAFALVALVLGVAACGGGGDDGAGDTGTDTAPVSDGASAEDAAGGEKTELPKKTVGILNVNGSDPAAIKCFDAAVGPMKKLGWKVVSVDAQGDPIKMASGMRQLVDQNVDAILLEAVDATAVGDGLSKAEEKKIPVVEFCGGGTPSRQIGAEIAPSDFVLAALAGDYVVRKLNGQGDVAIFTTDAQPWARYRSTVLKTVFSHYPDMKVVAVKQIDYAKYVNEVETATAAIARTNPNLKAIVTIVSPYSTPVATALRQVNMQDKVFSVSIFATEANLELIRQGKLAAVADANFGQVGYQAVDALVQHFGKGEPLSGAAAYRFPLQHTVITKDNLPTKADEADQSYVQFYEDLWASQFSNTGN